VSGDRAALEEKKIAGAVRTDFILSAQFVVIALGEMTDATMVARVLSLITVDVVMTVGVYGLVASIVKRIGRKGPPFGPGPPKRSAHRDAESS
jgi:predicted DNA repair protein MutK